MAMLILLALATMAAAVAVAVAECVDGRAVDNVRMLIADAVQNAKAGHPGMASAWRRWVIISTDM
ncbi:hypothetical protein QJS10_CPA09g01772 [Acorus calamus]|uniref:Uncharacterized protein n=1 Tax=Acorus calamus TaxID=4465 RepID=A0AAV9E4M5_ACOCL|nr:hypothetical protein QJS10_CPA09g01772 [Acorus calamus]